MLYWLQRLLADGPDVPLDDACRVKSCCNDRNLNHAYTLYPRQRKTRSYSGPQVRSNSEIRPGVHETTPAVANSGRDASLLWVAWSCHRRTTGLCAAWEVPLCIMRPKRSGPLRWAELSLKTLRLLWSSRPRILFVQNPSLALTVLAVLCRPVFGYYLVVDAHNEGIRPFDRPYAFVRWLTRRLLKSADVTIVTNEALAKDVYAAGGRPLVLPDKLPVVAELEPIQTRDSKTPDIVVIASFRPDEPIAAIMAAAKTMPDVRFAISGPAERYRGGPGSIPPNVQLTGFLQDPAYWRLLAQATVICDLTLKPDCLVCGAYEALAVGKPMILSDNPATRDIFGPAAVLTGSSPEEIATAVRKAIEDCERLEANAKKLRETYPVRWQREAAALWNDIEALPASGTRTAA